MSCVEISPDISYLLDALRTWPIAPEVMEQLRAMPEWETARAWGWIMQSGELTGFGARHASGELPRGIIR
jgi:hypothetical protein